MTASAFQQGRALAHPRGSAAFDYSMAPGEYSGEYPMQQAEYQLGDYHSGDYQQGFDDGHIYGYMPAYGFMAG